MGKRIGLRGNLAVLAVVAFAMCFAFVAPAVAQQQNPECLTCHQTMQDWSAGAVDRNTVCAKCHTPGLLGTHPFHNGGGNCGAVCHLPDGWGNSEISHMPNWVGAQGAFNKAESINATPGLLHIIHGNPRWPGNVKTTAEKCASCHAAATCSACHVGASAPAVGHDIHSGTGNLVYPKRTPHNATFAYGVVGGDLSMDTAVTEDNLCASTGCHDLPGTDTRDPKLRESHTHAPLAAAPWQDTVTYSPAAWRLTTGGFYTLQTAVYTNRAGYTMNMSVPARYFEVVTDVDPYRGYGEVWIDGALAGTFDCYSPTTAYQQTIWRSSTLSTGTHTIEIKATGTYNVGAGARGAYLFVDGIRAYEDVPDSIAPKCLTCHPGSSVAHGTTFAHEASQTVGTYAGFTCPSCHNLAMLTEHKRTSSKTFTGGSVCGACHPSYAPYTLNQYNYTCGGTGTKWDGAASACHVGSATQHNFVDTTHTVDASITSEAKCRSCHGGTLDVIHNNSITTNAVVTDCLDCHSATSFPPTKACTAGCHVATGVNTMETHPYVSPSHVASSTDTGVLNTGGFSCDTCHDTELKPEHIDKVTSEQGGARMTCSDCHDQTYLPRPWNDKCTQCHTSGKATVPHTGVAAAHDFSVNAANVTACGGLDCHDITKVDLLHDPSRGGNGNCTSCHDSVSSPTKKLCEDCHTQHAAVTVASHTTGAPSSHMSGAYAGSTTCLRCHENFSDINAAHPSCATCHNNTTLTSNGTRYLNDYFTAECTGCHTPAVLGKTFTPHDPLHYNGSETTHTASAQTGTEAGYACTQCHYLEMKPEHITKSTSVYPGVPSIYPDKCIYCHQVKVDAFTTTWDHTCTSCHATKHTDMTTKHNATSQVLSGVVSTVTVYAESFDATTTWPAALSRDTTGATYWRTTTTTYTNSPNAAELYASNTTRRTGSFWKTGIDLSTVTSPTISFKYQLIQTEASANNTDYAAVWWSTNGTTWSSFLATTSAPAGWTQVSASIPSSSTSITVKFWGSVNATNAAEYIRYDDITIAGRQRGTSPGTAGANCAGSGCHLVSDISVIHNNSITTNAMVPTCATCHSGPNAIATVQKDCNATGCHNGGHNMAIHNAPNSQECVNCHETAFIPSVHASCDQCHANPSYPGLVAGKTADCVSCHKAGTVGTHPYSPVEPQHYTGYESTHTAVETGTFQTYTCTTCHLLELKPEHAKTSASFAGTTTVYGKCVACHENKVDAFTTPWDDRCASCHALTHGDRAAKHNASTVGAACGGAGCHAITDVSVIHANSIKTNTMVPSCITCHDSNLSVPDTLTCEAVGCHAGMQHGHALDLTNSNYNNTTQVGCTNSGAGCHGSQATSPTPDYAITMYHKKGNCQSGRCHKLTETTTTVNPSQPATEFNNPQTCQNCHGGRAVAPLNYVNAADRVSITASSTNPAGGHYSDTTHTAAGLLSTAKAKADGLTTATCITCHRTTNQTAGGLGTLWYQHQALQSYGNTTCYECHNFNISVAAQVTGNWTTDQCTDCHAAGVMGATYSQHATSSAPVVLGIVSQTASASPGACDQGAGCHLNLDLHELHKGDGVSLSGRPDPQCNVCHDPLKQGWKPTEKTCGDTGACHITQPHLAIGPAHSVTALSEACIECHETTDLRINHGYTSTCSDGTNVCHNNPLYPSLPTGRQECVDCHQPGVVGTKTYAPHDPNHYVGTETTHTASSQTGTYGAITSVVATEGFNNSVWPTAWTRSDATRVLPMNNAPLDEGTFYAQIYNIDTTRRTLYFEKVFDTSVVPSPTIEFRYTSALYGAGGDYGRLEYSTNGTTFTVLASVTTTQSTWTTIGPLAVPQSGTLTLRWSASVNANNTDRFRIDSIALRPGNGPGHACNACHQMEIRPEHFKVSSEATRVPSIYPDKCIDCHENRTDVITGHSVPVTAHWNKTCDQCHGMSISHTHQASMHDASAIASACAGVGCHYVKDVAVIHNNSAKSNTFVSTCANTCHTSNLSLPASIDCQTVGCHAGTTAHAHELDVTASDYNNTTVTGCTNSGAGCHGNLTTNNYTDYHPANGCTAGNCHKAANHNDASFNGMLSCMNCHGGYAPKYDGATDAVGLTEAAPNGHYGETTHTAAAASLTASMTAGGTITARCNQCHSNASAVTTGNPTGIGGLFAQHQGLKAPYGNTGCSECHNYNAAITAEVQASWTNNYCIDCHKTAVLGTTYSQHATATAPSVVATEAQGAGTCIVTGCHVTNDLHALHKGTASTSATRTALGCAFAGCHDYSKQGWKPTGKSCGVGGACHTVDAHNPTAHNTADAENCMRCHEGQTTSTVDIRNVYLSPGFGNTPAHTCASCHNAGTNLGSVRTASSCTNCHNATDNTTSSGLHTFAPYQPTNHYYTTSHDASQTSSGSYGTLIYGSTLSDYHGTTINYQMACTSCHTIDLWTEHTKGTTISFNLGGKADKCVACHEGNGTFGGVDQWSVRWAGSCAGEANSCHNVTTLHNDWTTKHNATAETLTAPGKAFTAGSSGLASPTTTFGTVAGNFPNDSWATTAGAVYCSVGTTNAASGAAGMINFNATRTVYNFYRDFNLNGYDEGAVSFWYKVNVSSTSDYLTCAYSTNGGTTYTEIFRKDTDELTGATTTSLTIPGNATVRVRFTGTLNASGEYAAVDNVSVFRSKNSGFGSALATGTTVGASCSSNPNATECHDVTDIADIHSRTTGNGCAICHTGTTAHPTNKNCQASGCHVGINNTTHDTGFHESTISSTTLFGTGFDKSWCQGCHDDSIDNEHFVLSPYAATPCSVCHKKATNSSAPTSVTAVNTSSTIHGDTVANNELCTDCHKTVTKTKIHTQDAAETTSSAGMQFSDTNSGHRVYDSMYGAMTGGTTAPNKFPGVTYTVTRPTLSLWMTNWDAVRTETTTMTVRCNDCHGAVTGATGPHGSSMKVYMDSAYANNYSSGGAYLSSAGINGNPICAKCHNTGTSLANSSTNNVHSDGNHQGTTAGKCINCHIKVPHQWKRPFLLGYTTDPEPYKTLGLSGIAGANKTPTGWSKSNCDDAGSCTGHSTITGVWP